MIPIPPGVQVWLATGYTHMRCGFPSLALRVQEVLKHDPLGDHLFCFRGERGDLIKVVWHDGQAAADRPSMHSYKPRSPLGPSQHLKPESPQPQ
ncbi:IS66 Orf2 like protein [Rhizobium sp. NFR03]|nr:IS66 Orf2 like protein [Rhizobium sp. NFR03]